MNGKEFKGNHHYIRKTLII